MPQTRSFTGAHEEMEGTVHPGRKESTIGVGPEGHKVPGDQRSQEDHRGADHSQKSRKKQTSDESNGHKIKMRKFKMFIYLITCDTF